MATSTFYSVDLDLIITYLIGRLWLIKINLNLIKIESKSIDLIKKQLTANFLQILEGIPPSFGTQYL